MPESCSMPAGLPAFSSRLALHGWGSTWGHSQTTERLTSVVVRGMKCLAVFRARDNFKCKASVKLQYKSPLASDSFDLRASKYFGLKFQLAETPHPTLAVPVAEAHSLLDVVDTPFYFCPKVFRFVRFCFNLFRSHSVPKCSPVSFCILSGESVLSSVSFNLPPSPLY